MNNIMKQIIRTEKVNNQTAGPKANASVFLFFSNTHFLKTNKRSDSRVLIKDKLNKRVILASHTNGTFGFARHTSLPFAKPKEPFFVYIKELFLSFENIKWSRDHFKKREISKSHKIRINN